MIQGKGDHDVLNAEEAAAEAGVSPRVIREALRDGELNGRNLQGRKGWIITRRALSLWIDNGNNEEGEESAV